MASSGNFSTMNPLHFDNATFSKGNLLVSTDGNYADANSTFAMTSGKWYIEARNDGAGLGNFERVIGIRKTGSTLGTVPWSDSNKYVWFAPSGNIRNNSNVSYGSSWTADGDIIGIALDLDNNALWFSKNNTWQNSATKTEIENGTTTNAAFTGLTNEDGYTLLISSGDTAGRSTGALMYVNFGQDSTFAGAETAGGNADSNGFGDFKYAPPSGFLALSSSNLPISDDIDPAQTDANFPAKNFAPILYTGTGSNGNAITGLGFKPDLVFFQRRSAAGTYNNGLIDSNRGVTKGHYMNRTDAEANFTNDFASFDSDGFTLQAGSSANINNASTTFVAWCWRANEGTTTSDSSGDITVTRQVNDAAKFSICTWTGNGSSGSTLPHGLGAVPKMTWIKKRNATASTNVWHASFNSADPDSFGEPVGSAAWYANQGANGTFTTAPDATNLTLTAYAQVNGSSDTYVGYFWADVDGMQKFGGYTGNGNADGPFVYTGFRPSMIFFKRTDSTSGWTVVDTARYTANTSDGPGRLEWNTTAAEVTGGSATREMDILANGFKIRTSNSNINTSGGNYVYGAWASVPFKYNNTL